MSLVNNYTDAFLASRVTQVREDQAIADVAELGTLPATWVTRLQVLRCYIITCQEMMQSDDDTFAAKLKAYREDYKTAVQQARAAQAIVDANSGAPVLGGGSLFTVNLERS